MGEPLRTWTAVWAKGQKGIPKVTGGRKAGDARLARERRKEPLAGGRRGRGRAGQAAPRGAAIRLRSLFRSLDSILTGGRPRR